MSVPTPGDKASNIPSMTIEALSRGVFKEACNYGFSQVDIIKLINNLMDLCSAGVSRELEASDKSSDYRDIASADFQALPLTGERICIRCFQESTDREALDSWLPDRYGRFFVLSGATAQTITVDALISAPGNHLGIITLQGGEPIGAMAFLDHSKQQQRAELRKLIGDPNYRGKGLAEEATKLWINYGAHGLGLKKIYVSTLQTQIANVRLNERIGFQVEGLLRNEVLIDGERHDVLRMGLSID